MRVRLEYGRTGMEVDLPDERVVRTLAYKNAPPLADPEGELRRLLAAPCGTPPLAEIAKGILGQAAKLAQSAGVSIATKHVADSQPAEGIVKAAQSEVKARRHAADAGIFASRPDQCHYS